MNKTTTVTIVLLVLAVALGAVNLKIYSTLTSQGVRQQAAMGALADSQNVVQNASGTLVSISGSSLVMSVNSKNVALSLSEGMKFYTRNIMSDAKYQAALKVGQAPLLKKTGDATGSATEWQAPLLQDVLNQVKSVADLNLKAGDRLTVAYNGTLSEGKSLLEIIKIVETK